jgi:preprotein translocase subunit Sss1
MSVQLNEITVLIAINAVGIIALIGMFIYLVADSIFGSNKN